MLPFHIAIHRNVIRLLLVITGLLCVTAKLSAQGQQLLTDEYSQKTIYLYGHNRFIKNNVVYTGHRSLLNEFSASPGGLSLYLRSRRNRNIGMAVSLIGTAGSLYSLLNRGNINWRPFFWGSLATGLIAAPINATATKQLNQAVWLRNKDVLTSESFLEK